MALEAMAPDAGFSLSVRDVDARNEWAEAYGMKVPVLKLGEREICHFFLDHEAVQQALAEFGANGG